MSACVSSLAIFVTGRRLPTACRLCGSCDTMPVKPTVRRMLATLLPMAGPLDVIRNAAPPKCDVTSSDPTARRTVARDYRWRGLEGRG